MQAQEHLSETLSPWWRHAVILTIAFGFTILIWLSVKTYMVFALRQVVTEAQWVGPEKYIRVACWGLNLGLALMVVTNLFPGGVLQLLDVIENGYWHARSPEFRWYHRIVQWERWPDQREKRYAYGLSIRKRGGQCYRAEVSLAHP